jgi:hypothetical protein
MKKALFIIASSLSILTMPGCKKETGTNYAHLLNEKVWTGTLTSYNPEPFSVKFSTDGSFSWHEIKEDVNGTWKLDGPQLVLNFSSGKQLKAEFAADSTMGNIIGDDGKSITTVKPQLNTNADMSMDNIRWEITGSYDEVEFAGSRVTYYSFGFWDRGSYIFNRRNGTMRFSNGYDKGFFVIMPDGESIWMTGAFGNGMLKRPI